MKPLKYALAAAALSLSVSSFAQLAGHNVILVHGLMPDNIKNPPQSQQEIDNNGYEYWSQFWKDNSEARMDWSSKGRIEGEIAISIYNKAVELAQSGLCDSGCVMVTHSTGDLVTRYFLEHQADWLSARGLQPLNILATLDFGGAGGGTELASAAVSGATRQGGGLLVRAATRAYFGFNITQEDQLGTLIDLQPTIARNLATTPNNVPRLRFVGNGSQYFGITERFILGEDDGVVPSHSSCGAAKAEAYNSCSRSVAFDGKRTSVSGPSAFMANHFPVLMGDGIHHSGTKDNQVEGKLTYVNNGIDANGMKVNFATHTKRTRSWWRGDYTYQYVTGSDQISMSAMVVKTINM